MSFDPMRVQTITFDSYSTLVDPESAASVLEEYVDNPKAVARQWHSMAVRYATVTNEINAYQSYFDLHQDALRCILIEHGIDASDSHIEEMTSVYYDLTPFDDVYNGMKRLSEEGYTLAILSNGSPKMLENLLSITDTKEFVDECISAAEIGKFKPNNKLYKYAANRLNTPIESVTHVGAGWGDIMGCMHAGMQGVWLNRKDIPWPQFNGHPDLAVKSLHEFTNYFIGM